MGNSSRDSNFQDRDETGRATGRLADGEKDVLEGEKLGTSSRPGGHRGRWVHIRTYQASWVAMVPTPPAPLTMTSISSGRLNGTRLKWQSPTRGSAAASPLVQPRRLRPAMRKSMAAY